MTTQGETPKQELHKKFAVELFNLVWELMEKEERTPEDSDKMLHAAHASRYHWGEIGTPLEFGRGEWQVSRVYSILKRPRSALFHAERCLEICTVNGIGDFDLAFAYEAIARAHAVAGDSDRSREYVALGKQAGEEIEDKGNREYFLSELSSISGLLE